MDQITHNMYYSIEELNGILQSYSFNKLDNSYNGQCVYKILQNNVLPGEIFRLYNKSKSATQNFREAFWNTEKPKSVKIEVSNLGRVKINDQIKPQYQNEYGYLYINVAPDIPYEVYRLVAETWLECPVEDTVASSDIWVVHHITDNGFDNRSSNLLWCTKDVHKTLKHKANESNCKINSDILKQFDDILTSKQNDIDKEMIIDYLEDICALQRTRKNVEAISKIKKIIELFKIDKAKYPYINWDMAEHFMFKD